MTRGTIFCLLLAGLVGFALCGEDFYKILGVSRDSSERDLRKAYHKLANKYHPDKNPGDSEASDKFMEIARAYEVLSDQEKRSIYDRYGEEGLKSDRGFQYHDPFDIFSQFSGGRFNFNFGGQGGHAHGGQAQQRGPETVMDMDVTLDDLYNGRSHSILLSRQVLCHHCRGTGGADPDSVKTCDACNGKGVRVTVQRLGPGIVQQMQSQCDVCGGTGKVVKEQCPHCKGSKVEMGEEYLELYVERGMGDGETIVFEGKGDEHPDHLAGNLVFRLRQIPHPVFTRRQDNLYMNLNVSLVEALTGFEREFSHLDGRTVKVARNDVVRPGQVIGVRNEGMPHHKTPSSRGTLYIEITVIFPKKLTPEKQEQLKKILS